MDVARSTHTVLCWNTDSNRILSDSWKGFTKFTQLKEKLPKGYMSSGERLTRVQATSRPDHLWPELWRGMARNAGQLKNQSSIKQEDYVGSISLTQRIRNSKKPLRMLARNWKRRWLLLCLARHARKANMGRPVAKPMRSNQNLRVSWKPVNPQECVWKNLFKIIMRTILQEERTIHCNITIWYTNLFLCPKQWRYPQQRQQWTRNWENWRKFRRGTWRKSEANQRWSMKQGRKA